MRFGPWLSGNRSEQHYSTRFSDQTTSLKWRHGALVSETIAGENSPSLQELDRSRETRSTSGATRPNLPEWMWVPRVNSRERFSLAASRYPKTTTRNPDPGLLLRLAASEPWPA